MENSEKRIFGAKKTKEPLTEDKKGVLKNKFIKELEENLTWKIKPTDIVETENDDCWALLYCDGARVYRLMKYKKELSEFKNDLFKEEKNIMKNLFLKLAEAVEGTKIDKAEIIDEENESFYIIRHVSNAKEELKIEFKKKNICIE